MATASIFERSKKSLRLTKEFLQLFRKETIQIMEKQAETKKTLQPIVWTKRVGYLYEHVTDYGNCMEAIKDAARHKKRRQEVQKVLKNLDAYAHQLQKMLIDESWIPSGYTIRPLNDGIQKKRRIIAIPRFWPDQCVHHAFIRVFKKVVQHSAYEWSCGCVPGKGTRGAKDAIERWLRKDPKHTTKVLKLDVHHCYPTISHKVLRDKLEKRIKDKRFLRLAFQIIATFQQPMITGERLLPEPDAVGLPIGLYPSPWFCNFYFQDLDHKIAGETGCAHNVRYVDDMVLLDGSKKRLHEAMNMISEEVTMNAQTVKDDWQVFNLEKRPLDFLGYRFTHDRTIIRKSIMFRISRKARTIWKAAYISAINAAAMVSYWGYIVNSNSWNFFETYIKPFVNYKILKGVVRNENRKQYEAVALQN